MSLHFILDGYNIIKKIPSLSHLEIKDSRDRLLGLIDTYKPQGSSKNKIDVIFDGKSWVNSYPQKLDKRVFFTKDTPADEKIKRMVKSSLNAKQIVVVSDDRDIQIFVRGCGAKIMTVSDFSRKLKNKKSPAKEDCKFRINPEEASKITKELRSIWLKGDQKD